jgi:hypothetical protein
VGPVQSLPIIVVEGFTLFSLYDNFSPAHFRRFLMLLGDELRRIRNDAKREQERIKRFENMSPLERTRREMAMAGKSEEDDQRFIDGKNRAEKELEAIKDRLCGLARKDTSAHEFSVCNFWAKLRTYMDTFDTWNDEWDIEPEEKGYAKTFWDYFKNQKMIPQVKKTSKYEHGKGSLCELIVRW